MSKERQSCSWLPMWTANSVRGSRPTKEADQIVFGDNGSRAQARLVRAKGIWGASLSKAMDVGRNAPEAWTRRW